MIHNASIEKYRTPVGAVTCGSEMTIRLYETGESVSKAEIIMYSETFHREYEMKRKKDCMEEHLKITNGAGIVWYYFRIWEHGRCYFYGAKHGQTQGEESKYYDWYDFDEDGTYKSWWGFETLPEVNELNEKFVDYIITGEDSVIKHWLSLGASGFRLDVADELPDEFIFKLRSELKNKFKNYALIGEVWEDVTTKESYGTKRKYALGKGLDSAMNYPLKVNVTDYLLGNQSAEDMKTFLLSQQCNYPKPLYYALMNLLSSHDIPRIRTTLATGMNENFPSREQQAEYVITSKMDQKGKSLTRLAIAVQFFVPGMPCIYYGDEYGMHGLMDPFNRGTFFENDKETYQDVLKLTNMRNREKVLQTGHALYMAADDDVLAILRFISSKKDVFGEACENKALLLLINPTQMEKEIEIDLAEAKEGVSESELQLLSKNLTKTVVKTKVAPMDYKIIEL